MGLCKKGTAECLQGGEGYYICDPENFEKMVAEVAKEIRHPELIDVLNKLPAEELD